MIGKTLSHYQITEKLGRGGMGVVYKAEDTKLCRSVALKFLPEELSKDRQALDRFQREARAASALNHPNICTVYDVDESDGQPFIAMEFIAGDTLREKIHRGPADLKKLLDCLVQVARGLAKAHAAGIVHRDLKPDNIMITRDGFAKILDFGLAKLVEQHQPYRAAGQGISEVDTALLPPPQSTPGLVMGSCGYMSPEQAQGKTAEIDPRSDIFSFGCVLYEAATKRNPFAGDSVVDTLHRIIYAPARPIRELNPAAPAELQRIVRRCLAKDPEERYQTIHDVALELKDLSQEMEGRAEWGHSATPAQRSGNVPGQREPAATGDVVERAARSKNGGQGRSMSTPESILSAVRRHKRSTTVLLLLLGSAAGIGLALYQLLGPNPFRPRAPGPAMRTLPFTAFPGEETQATFSPDGNQIAFGWNGEKEDNADIYLKQIGAGGLFRLTSHPASDTSPAWSPDGRYIASVRHSAEKGGFYLIPALGGAERKLAEAFPERLALPEMFWSSLSYSPDGEFLAVADKSSSREPFSLFLLSVETGVKRPLTSPAGGHRGDYNPVFSPDGKMLAFIRFSSGMANDIYLVPVAGGEPRRLISEAYFAYMTMGLAWTAEGREIVFAADRGGSFGLWRVPATGGTPERVAGVGPNAGQPSISRQGNRLAYTQTTMDSNLWRMQLSSSKGGSRTPAKPLAPSTQFESNIDSSPDGQRIVFVSNRSGWFEIWVCEADGSNPVPLTHFGDSSSDDPGSPRWSRDGRYVAFDLFTEGQRDIAVVSAEGDRPRRLTREASQECIPSWSADGRWVYFNSDRSGTYQIWKVPAQGGEALPVTKGGGFECLESPDGKFLYYTKGREVPGIWRVPVGGGQETLVLDHHRAGYWRAWDVVADGIYFATAEVTSRPEIEFFSFATGRVTQIAQLEKPIFTTDQGLTVSPDQRWLGYVQIDQSGRDIMLVENFR